MTEDFVINKDLVYSTLGVPKAAMTIHGHDPNRLIDDFKDENGMLLNVLQRNSSIDMNNQNPIFIIDPYGRAVMFFPPDTDPKEWTPDSDDDDEGEEGEEGAKG